MPNPNNFLGPKRLSEFTDEVTDSIVKANELLQIKAPGLIADCSFSIEGEVDSERNADFSNDLKAKLKAALDASVKNIKDASIISDASADVAHLFSIARSVVAGATFRYQFSISMNPYASVKQQVSVPHPPA